MFPEDIPGLRIPVETSAREHVRPPRSRNQSCKLVPRYSRVEVSCIPAFAVGQVSLSRLVAELVLHRALAHERHCVSCRGLLPHGNLPSEYQLTLRDHAQSLLREFWDRLLLDRLRDGVSHMNGLWVDACGQAQWTKKIEDLVWSNREPGYLHASWSDFSCTVVDDFLVKLFHSTDSSDPIAKSTCPTRKPRFPYPIGDHNPKTERK